MGDDIAEFGEDGAPDAFEVVAVTPSATVEAGDLDAGSVLLLVRNAVARLKTGEVLEVRASGEGVGQEVAAWAKLNRCELVTGLDAGLENAYLVRKGEGAAQWDVPDWGVRLPVRPGRGIDIRDWFVGRVGEVPEEAPTYWGFVPRGAVPEKGMPDYPYVLNRKDDVWADNIASLYEQAKAQQWNASVDIAWDAIPELPDDLERSVCQVMTFLAENEYAALYIPAKFLPRINAQYVEPVMFLATIINDEARHIEAFTKRAL
ncbi:MAG: hypothetical protein ACRDKW_01925, partial [Actinomycetota bacterium]